jgi:hypothetical protein
MGVSAHIIPVCDICARTVLGVEGHNMKTFRLVMVLASLFLVLAGGTRIAANTFYPATLTFSDRVDDKITSDYLVTGKHTYENGGPDKLECGFWVLPNNDFVLRAPAGGTAKLPRFVAFSLTPITPPNAPAGSLEQRDIFMNIRDILTLPNGTAKTTIAIFGTAFGSLKLTPSWVDTSTYATEVFVSRTGTEWTVTADPGVPPGPGDVAALTKVKSNKEQLVGLYHVPFQITVTCPTCP